MASVYKEESDQPGDQSSNAFTSDNNFLKDDHLHKSKEFTDIHREHQDKKACCTEKNDLHFSESASIGDSIKKDLNIPLLNEDNECVNSSLDSRLNHTLKTLVHFDDNTNVSDSGDFILKNDENNSDDEYQSADDGDDDQEERENRFVRLANTGDCGDEDDEAATASDENEMANEESEDKEKESDIVDDLEVRKSIEEKLTEEERKERQERGQKFKEEGNEKFRSGHYDEAILAYTEALDICPLNFHKERSIMFANRAACKMKKEMYEGAIQDSTSALDLHPHYLKALLRRAELYEKTEKLDEALKDYQKVVELDPSQGLARAACVKLAEQIKDRNEKMKEEMIGKLKDLGNLVLRPFGLSVNNFNLQKDPVTGSYSVQFQQNPPSNGS